MRWMHTAVAAVGLLVTCTVARAGQAPRPGHSVTPGERVRLATTGNPPQRMVGVVVESDGESLLVRPAAGGQPVRMHLTDVRRVDVQRGRRSLVREGALVGFVPGAAFGFFVGSVLGCDDQGPGCVAWPAALTTGAVCGAATAVVGAAAGLLFKVDRWERVRTPRATVHVVPAPGHGLAVGVRVAF